MSIANLAPSGVYTAIDVATDAVGSYPTFSTLPTKNLGGMFSVALIPRVASAGR